MENLFFPAHRAYSLRPTLRPTPPPLAQKSRVISIPVHFANDKPGSPEPDRSSAAVKIQKLLRGFLVRKNIQTVKKIAAEAAEIGHQISALKIRADAKERLRIGEMLMSLLLRLDAVRGVREYRKKVIRQVIQLQEAVDSIALGESPDFDESKLMDDMVIPAGDGENDELLMDDCPIAAEETEEVEPPKEVLMLEEASKDSDKEIEGGSWGMGESIENSMEEVPVMAELTPAGGAAAEETEEVEPPKEVLMLEEASKNSDKKIEGGSWGMGESIENSMEEVPVMAELTPAGGAAAEVVAGMKEAMERASAETEALRTMVGELCERSAHQCELMRGLVQRVEQMERRMQRLERGRKKQAGGSPFVNNKQ